MKKKLTAKLALITTAVISTLSFAWPAVALDITGKLQKVGTAAQFSGDQNKLPETIGLIIQAFLSLIGIIFMAYILYGGYTWMTAKGNEEQLTKAKAIIRGSVIGLIIVFGAYAITAFVVSRLITSTGYTPN
ncbi:MAG: hypothetical protein WC768_04670 [Patescibacteria group bacterium]|jgi:cytochrome bd-type quinol oxidase subunit 2